jgi:pimeloyl-ACP methyl ester carboxylesterase
VGWNPVRDALSERYDVIALDLPGFGQATAFPDDVLPTARVFADAVEREMDALGVESFHVAGYSLGARVGLELASRGRIRSVVAIAPDGLGTPPERVYQATALMTGRGLSKVLSPVSQIITATGFGRSLFFIMERSFPWRLGHEDARNLLQDFAKAPGYEATVLAAMLDVPLGLGQIECPVLIMQGTADPLVSLQSPRFLSFIPQARIRWLPGLSHVPISDDPDGVASAMLDFLTAVTATPVTDQSEDE